MKDIERDMAKPIKSSAIKLAWWQLLAAIEKRLFIQTRCAWCDGIERDAWVWPRKVSHGMCPACFARQQRELFGLLEPCPVCGNPTANDAPKVAVKGQLQAVHPECYNKLLDKVIHDPTELEAMRRCEGYWLGNSNW